MREPVAIEDFIGEVEGRKRVLGMAPEDLAAARNSGRRRKPEKGEQLARIQERARAAGRQPVPAYF